MKRSAMAKIVSGKVKNWLKSIDDDDLRKYLADKIIVTGGCFVSLMDNEVPNDFDIYLTTKEATTRVAQYYVNEFNAKFPTVATVITSETPPAEDIKKLIKDARKKVAERHNTEAAIVTDEDVQNYIDDYQAIREKMSDDRVKIYIPSQGVSGSAPESSMSDEEQSFMSRLEQADSIEYRNDIKSDEGKGKYTPVYMSSNAITLTDKIQIIIRFFGEICEIHDNYDFVHCKNYWTSAKNEVVLVPEALESYITKHLSYCGSKYPLCSIIRTRKFIKRGWHINAGQYLKMCMQISNLDLTDIEVLEEQLVGVDSAYFGMFIETMKEHSEEHPDAIVDQDYVCTLIDKIFN